jgi:hypothetical protein
MENKIIYAISEKNDDGDMASTHLQVFRDSLENSINLTNTVNNASLNVLLFYIGLTQHDE